MPKVGQSRLERMRTAVQNGDGKLGAVGEVARRMDPKATIRAASALGWSLTPAKGKKPFLKGWNKRPRATKAEALEWVKSGHNVGVRTGRGSKLVVIDEDEPGAADTLKLPATVVSRTGGGGRHYYFAYSGQLGNSVGKLAPRVDTRGDDGQVLAPDRSTTRRVGSTPGRKVMHRGKST